MATTKDMANNPETKPYIIPEFIVLDLYYL
jgi:hypothetical protein